MKRVIVPMPDDLIDAADVEAARQDRSRAWIIRAAVAEYTAARNGVVSIVGPVKVTNTEIGPHAYEPVPGGKCQVCGLGKMNRKHTR